ncbi:MAG: hypothetical protein L6Q65_16605, partial [Zoogloea sp.]|nr:hypothetical protein [Zoogloea sp.]
AAAPVPTVDAAPAPQVELVTAPASPADAGEPALRARLEAWLVAWSARYYDAYRAFYVADFKPGKGRSTAQWEAERRQRLADAKSPSLRIEGLRLKTRGAGRYSTLFVQHYSAVNYRDTVKKQLDWVKVDGQWKIAGETVLAAPAKAD